MNLKNVSTKELVEELAKREAVERIVVEPYEPCTVTVSDEVIWDNGGPAVILMVLD